MRTVKSILESVNDNCVLISPSPRRRRYLRPLITVDQRAEKKRWYREYKRRLIEERKEKNERDGKFQINLKAWLKTGLIEPGVNVLKYKDVEGVTHQASILPNGKLQADKDGAPIYLSVRMWVQSIVEIGGSGSNKRLEWETRRVHYRRMPMTYWFRLSRPALAEE